MSKETFEASFVDHSRLSLGCVECDCLNDRHLPNCSRECIVQLGNVSLPVQIRVCDLYTFAFIGKTLDQVLEVGGGGSRFGHLQLGSAFLYFDMVFGSALELTRTYSGVATGTPDDELEDADSLDDDERIALEDVDGRALVDAEPSEDLLEVGSGSFALVVGSGWFPSPPPASSLGSGNRSLSGYG